MDAAMILQAISTVGFPIVCCGALFWMINKQTTAHKEEINCLTEAINNNTLVIQKMLDRMEVM